MTARFTGARLVADQPGADMSDPNSAIDRMVRMQREQWEAHTQRFNSEVGGSERLAWDSMKIAADFGKLGLSSAILVNGGALVAIPPLMQWLTPVARAQVSANAIWFLLGLLMAAAAVVVAYVNFTTLSESKWAWARQRAIELISEYKNKKAEDDPAHGRAKTLSGRFSKAATLTAWIALILACASYGCFAAGAFSFMRLAHD
jgi:hypothetical protein